MIFEISGGGSTIYRHFFAVEKPSVIQLPANPKFQPSKSADV